MWTPESEKHFREQIRQYNVLINSSFISNGAQQKILETVREEWTSGHVINIGSTAEYEGRNSVIPQLYCIQKRALRDLSLSMNSNKFKTTHITVGGLNDGKADHKNWLDVIEVAKIIKFVLDSNVSIPIIGIEKI
jgi:NAD(P)-dependent dehydrogenase (short-subunit alcohol dehydrogenase family)